jgi:hypothetical protein
MRFGRELLFQEKKKGRQRTPRRNSLSPCEISSKRRQTMKKVISLRTVVLLSSILWLGMGAPGMAKMPGGGGGSTTGCSSPGGTFSVTSYIFNSTTSNPFQLQNDGNSKYTTYKSSRTDSATSAIQGNTCDWMLDLTNSKSRTVQLSLDFPVSSGESLPSGWPQSGGLVSLPALVMTNCGRNPVNGSTSVGNMTGGQTIQCGLHVTFYSGGTQYSLRMNAIEWPGATWGQVTCTNADSSNLCNTWTVSPGQDANGQYAQQDPYTQQSTGIGALVLPPCNGCAGGTLLGYYYVDLSGMITKP